MIRNSLRFAKILVFVLCWSNTVRSLSKSDCRCRLGARRRIVGGQLSDFVPWQVALFYSGGFTCSGFIINEEYIATAQHCITDRMLTNLKVRVAKKDLLLALLLSLFLMKTVVEGRGRHRFTEGDRQSAYF